MRLNDVDAEKVRAAFASKQWWIPTARQKFNLAVFGVRADSLKVGLWDDALGVLFYGNGGLEVHVWRGTTDPGREGTAGALNDGGVARLIPGRYPLCWTIGTHKAGTKSAHRALVQRTDGVFKVWRDKIVDGALQASGRVYSDAGGLNMHGPWRDELSAVGDASWGCQVFHDHDDQVAFMAMCDAQVSNGYGSSFSYALFTASELPVVLGAVR